MRSPYLDSVLQLFDDRNQLLASDDNSAGGFDAKIVYQLDRTGTHLITAGDRSIADGSYILTLLCNPSPPKPPPTPPPVALRGDQSFLQLARGEATVVNLKTTTTNFESAITFSASGLPAGVNATFTPTSLPSPGDGIAAAMIAVSAVAVPGSYSFTLLQRRL